VRTMRGSCRPCRCTRRCAAPAAASAGIAPCTSPHTPSHTLTHPPMPPCPFQVPSFYRLARDHTVFRTVREPAIFFLHFAVMGGAPSRTATARGSKSAPRWPAHRTPSLPPLPSLPPTAPTDPSPPCRRLFRQRGRRQRGSPAHLVLRDAGHEPRDGPCRPRRQARHGHLEPGLAGAPACGPGGRSMTKRAALAAADLATDGPRRPRPRARTAGPLGYRAAPGPHGARATAQGSASRVADFAAFDPTRRCRRS
jgi:hypothetical protein